MSGSEIFGDLKLMEKKELTILDLTNDSFFDHELIHQPSTFESLADFDLTFNFIMIMK